MDASGNVISNACSCKVIVLCSRFYKSQSCFKADIMDHTLPHFDKIFLSCLTFIQFNPCAYKFCQSNFKFFLFYSNGNWGSNLKRPGGEKSIRGWDQRQGSIGCMTLSQRWRSAIRTYHHHLRHHDYKGTPRIGLEM